MKNLLFFLIFVAFSPTVIGQINHKEDEEEFLKSIQLFAEANEIGERMMEKVSKGEIPNAHEFVKKVTDGIAFSEKVSYSYLDSKSPDLFRIYNDFVGSYKQMLFVYDEVRDPNEVDSIQKEVSQKQYRFFSFMERNQELFSDQIEITQPDEPKIPKKKRGIKDLFWFLGKAFLAIFPFIFGLALVSLVFNGIAFGLNKINKNLVMAYLTLISIIYLYFYGFLGAYYRELFEYYSTLFGKKWLLFIFCLIAIGFFTNQFNKELKAARYKLNQNHPLGTVSLKMQDKFSDEDIGLLATVFNFRGCWMVFVSFILFSFLPAWTSKLYGNLPTYFATLFT